jgi:hypothetical protein
MAANLKASDKAGWKLIDVLARPNWCRPLSKQACEPNLRSNNKCSADPTYAQTTNTCLCSSASQPKQAANSKHNDNDHKQLC